MNEKSVHEPDAKLMSATDVWDDAMQLSAVLHQNLLKAEPMVSLQIPFSLFLSALDSFDQEELAILHRQVEERLAA